MGLLEVLLPTTRPDGQSRLLVFVLTLVISLLVPVTAAAPNCASIINCDVSCKDERQRNQMPQHCDDCCPRHETNEKLDATDMKLEERIVSMEVAVTELRVMVGVLLGLVLLLIMAAVATYIRSSTKALKMNLPVFFRSKDGGKDEGRASIEKRPPPTTKIPPENRNSTVVRIADYQNNHSPLNRRMRPCGPTMPEDPRMVPTYPPSTNLPQTRQPSESTCPDDSTDLPDTHQHAYDNLALSTSTLNDTTSTSTLGPAVSTNTLDTTLPSVHPTTPVLRSVSAQ